MTKEELEKDYYADRPTEPYSDDDSPNDWANIAHYAEENLEKAFKRIAELEKENAELNKKYKRLDNLEDFTFETYRSFKLDVKELARLFESRGYRLDGAYQENIELQEQLTKAKEKISKLLEIIKRPYQFNALRKIQLVNEAVQFLSEVEK